MRLWTVAIGAGGLLGVAIWLAGCESAGASGKRQMAVQSTGHPIRCRKCYDETVTARRTSPRGRHLRPVQTIKRHMCPDCKAEMAIYTEDGKPMIKCAGCAPEGVACDKCLPPKSTP